MHINWQEILTNAVYPGLATFLTSLISVLIGVSIRLIKSVFKTHAHFKGDAVVQESLIQAFSQMGDAFARAFEDGSLSEVEKKQLKELAAKIAEEKLKRLYGFYKSDLIGWINERVDIAFPKFISPKVKAFVSKNL